MHFLENNFIISNFLRNIYKEVVLRGHHVESWEQGLLYLHGREQQQRHLQRLHHLPVRGDRGHVGSAVFGLDLHGQPVPEQRQVRQLPARPHKRSGSLTCRKVTGVCIGKTYKAAGRCELCSDSIGMFSVLVIVALLAEPWALRFGRPALWTWTRSRKSQMTA